MENEPTNSNQEDTNSNQEDTNSKLNKDDLNNSNGNLENETEKLNNQIKGLELIKGEVVDEIINNVRSEKDYSKIAKNIAICISLILFALFPFYVTYKIFQYKYDTEVRIENNKSTETTNNQ